tara:strand:+ start:3615 stop:4127 length:513 start_codon:yes stop_codon:yes gene_type:complete
MSFLILHHCIYCSESKSLQTLHTEVPAYCVDNAQLPGSIVKKILEKRMYSELSSILHSEKSTLTELHAAGLELCEYYQNMENIRNDYPKTSTGYRVGDHSELNKDSIIVPYYPRNKGVYDIVLKLFFRKASLQLPKNAQNFMESGCVETEGWRLVRNNEVLLRAVKLQNN